MEADEDFAAKRRLCIKRGSGQDRTVDLTIFSRALVPTELPSQYFLCRVNERNKGT